MRELLEQGAGVAIIGGMTVIGVLVRVLLPGYYGWLGRACKRFEETKNKTITYIREDLKRREEKGQEIKNVSVYTEYRLAQQRLWGIRIGSLEGMVLYSLLLTGVCSVLLLLACIWLECGRETIAEQFFFGGVAMTGLLVLDAVTGLREKRSRVRLGIRDYIENRPDRCSAEMAPVQARGADKLTRAGKQKKGKAQEEKRRLTEELLRERRQLEARSLAEQRRKEKDEESFEKRIQVEASVTECREEQVESAKPEYRDEQTETAEIEYRDVQAEAAVTECREEEPDEVAEAAKGKSELSYEALLTEFLRGPA